MAYRPYRCDEKQPEEEEEEDICNLKEGGQKDKKEKILLLEFLVETLEIDHHIINSQPELKSGRTIVQFSFLNLPPLEFNEDALPVGRFKSACDFKNGKSCLFSVPDFPCIPQDILEINILVIRELCPGIIPNKMPIAKTTIDLTTVYQILIKEARAHPYCLPISRSHKECYLLTNLTGTRIAGSIGVFIRASCFGKIIVSHFHMGSRGCLFQGSPQVHPIMYQYQSIATGPQDAKDIVSEEDISKPADDAAPGPSQDIPAVGAEKPEDATQRRNSTGAEGRKSIKSGQKSQLKDPQEAGPRQDRTKSKAPCPQNESEGATICPEACGYVCPEAEEVVCPQGGPVINLMDAGPGESFYVERGYCECDQGAVCVCDKLQQFVGSKAHKVKELETEVCGHAISMRIPKTSEETNWYELDINRLFNEEVPCECRGVQTEPVPCGDYDRSEEEEEDIPPICGGKPCGGVCASGDKLDIPPICGGKPCGGVCTAGYKSGRSTAPPSGVDMGPCSKGKDKIITPRQWIPPELIPHFTSVKEYAGKTDIQVKTPYDPVHDIFVLKISKKGESPEAKPQLELELRTPKRPVPSPVTRLTQEIQYDPADIKGAGGGGGGKKGNPKGKGKKGKKKKK